MLSGHAWSVRVAHPQIRPYFSMRMLFGSFAIGRSSVSVRLDFSEARNGVQRTHVTLRGARVGALGGSVSKWACPDNLHKPQATPGLARLLGGIRVRPKTRASAQGPNRPLPPITCAGRPSERTHGAKPRATDPRGSPLRGMLCVGCGVARVRVPDAGRTKPAAKSPEREPPRALGRGESEPFRARPGSPHGTWTKMWRAWGATGMATLERHQYTSVRPRHSNATSLGNRSRKSL